VLQQQITGQQTMLRLTMQLMSMTQLIHLYSSPPHWQKPPNAPTLPKRSNAKLQMVVLGKEAMEAKRACVPKHQLRPPAPTSKRRRNAAAHVNGAERVGRREVDVRRWCKSSVMHEVLNDQLEEDVLRIEKSHCTRMYSSYDRPMVNTCVAKPYFTLKINPLSTPWCSNKNHLEQRKEKSVRGEANVIKSE
jgi:hypothetical protein